MLIVFCLTVYWIVKVLARNKNESFVRKRKESLARKKKEAGIRKEKERFLPLGKDLRGGKAMLGRRSGGHR